MGIAAAIFKGDFEDSMKTALRNSMHKFGTSDDDKQAWENVQGKVRYWGVLYRGFKILSNIAVKILHGTVILMCL